MAEVTKGERIRQARNEKGLTQEEFAEAIGVVVKIVKDYEGDRRNPKTDRWPVIAEALGRPVGWFFGDLNGAPEVRETAPRYEPESTEQRLMTMLERQQALLAEQLERQQTLFAEQLQLSERQRSDIANLTEAIKVQQTAFLAEREWQQKLASRQIETIEELRAEVAELRAQSKPKRGQQQLLDAPSRPGRAGAM